MRGELERSGVLAKLVSPVTATDFVSSYWQRRPLRVRARHARLPFLRSNVVDDLLASGALRSEQLRLVKKGIELSTTAFVDTRDAIDAMRVRAAYDAGVTIILSNADRTHAPLGRLCRELDDTLGGTTQVNLYLTPAGASAFAAHWDNHDVFVVQLAGRKHWLVGREPSYSFPLGCHAFDPREFRAPSRSRAFVLNPGDVLYVPRGWAHQAACDAERHSLHATVGVTPITWRDLLRAAIDRWAEEEPHFRTAVTRARTAEQCAAIAKLVSARLQTHWAPGPTRKRTPRSRPLLAKRTRRG